MWLRLIRNPILFQGRNKKKNYFEGWYFKQVSNDGEMVVSIIPGISLGGLDPHCFIQVIASRHAKEIVEAGDEKDSHGSDTYKKEPEKNNSLLTEYFRFKREEFTYEDEPFAVKIGENRFSKTGISLFLESETIQIKGQIKFGHLQEIGTTWRQPGIMGFFSYIPKMECSHGIVSMSHSLAGTIELNGEVLDFEKGKGYIEKDWGTSFPKSYLWLQSNHFDGTDATFMCSVAHIPFLGSSFKGFICNLIVAGKEYRFASYNGSTFEVVAFSKTFTQLILKRRNLVLRVEGKLEKSGLLKAPHLGEMSYQIKEGLSGTVTLTLENDKGENLFRGVGNQCGIELMPG